MIYPPIAIVGSSGSGKSSSIKGLNPQRTRLINIENKLLPFREAKAFNDNNIIIRDDETKGIIAVGNGGQFENELTKAKANVDIDVIVIESFSDYSNELMKRSKKLNKGYDIYNWYADRMVFTIDLIKSIRDKWVIVLSRDELVEFMAPNGTRTTSRRIGVHGKKLEGEIESNFTIVLFTEVNQPDKQKAATYHFVTNNDGTTSAKSPAGMFDNRLIDNNLALVIKRASEYWEIPMINLKQSEPIAYA